MKVAIVMPYYNERDLLVTSVQSILNQTYTNWHLYLIDDGSAKGNRAHEVQWTPELMSKVTFCYKPNGGVSTARNCALSMIVRDPTGPSYDLVAYCDSDDVWAPDYLEQQVKALTLLGSVFNEADMVYAAPDHRFVDGTKAVPYGIADYPEFPGTKKLLEGNCIFVSGVVHKVKCLDVGFFDQELNSIEDWDYWARISEAGYKIRKNPNATFVYTVKIGGNGSKSNSTVYEEFHKKHSAFK